MSILLWVLVGTVLVLAALRVRSLASPRAFPPWMTPMLETPLRNRGRIVLRAGVRPSERMLEIGPGAGWLSEALLGKLGTDGQLTCLDIQIEMLRKVRARLGERTPWLVCSSGSCLPFREGTFDRAFLQHVLGEIPDKKGAAAELARVIRSGGELAVGEGLPDPDYIRAPVLRQLVTEAGFELGERVGSWWEYTHRFRRP